MLRPFAHLLLPCCSLDAPSCSLVLPRAPSLLPWCSSLLPHCSLSRSKMTTRNPKFGVYILYIYSFPEPRLTRDQLLTQASPLCSPAKAYFVPILSICSLTAPHAPSLLARALPRAPSMLPRCSLVAPPQPLPILLPFAPTVEFLQVSTRGSIQLELNEGVVIFDGNCSALLLVNYVQTCASVVLNCTDS